jgi:hypothetical protein
VCMMETEEGDKKAVVAKAGFETTLINY